MLEKIIAYHCAPALAGIKPSNIVSCSKSQIENIHSKLKNLNNSLNLCDIYIESLCECENKVLVLVYRRSVLEKHLNIKSNKAFLANFGYGGNNTAAGFIECLKMRLTSMYFPHEIGVFLGYPLGDVYCFITNPNEGCLLTGEWKVYHNAAEAQKLFDRFNSCRKALLKRINSGKTLAEVFKKR